MEKQREGKSKGMKSKEEENKREGNVTGRKRKGVETQREVHNDDTQERKSEWKEQQREGNAQGRKNKKDDRAKVGGEQRGGRNDETQGRDYKMG